MYCQRQSNNLINKIQETLLEREGFSSIHQKNIQTLATEIFKKKII